MFQSVSHVLRTIATPANFPNLLSLRLPRRRVWQPVIFSLILVRADERQ
jgi:hypothetical protein